MSLSVDPPRKHPHRAFSLEWAERALFSGELEDVGGRVCVWVCVLESVLLSQPTVQVPHQMTALPSCLD